jgi:hypothetical protein
MKKHILLFFILLLASCAPVTPRPAANSLSVCSQIRKQSRGYLAAARNL